MIRAEIHTKLDEMLETPRLRNFLNHLVKEYFPITNVDKVWDKQPNEIACVLSGEKLTTVQDIIDASQSEEFKENFITHLKSIFDEKATSVNPIMKLVADKKLAVTGRNTTTFMSYPAFIEFYEWVLTKFLQNNKHITWLLNGIKKNSITERAEGIQDEAVQSKIKKMKKTSMVSTYTLGETDAFKALREKFKN